jgi:hypothetical protein
LHETFDKDLMTATCCFLIAENELEVKPENEAADLIPCKLWAVVVSRADAVDL